MKTGKVYFKRWPAALLAIVALGVTPLLTRAAEINPDQLTLKEAATYALDHNHNLAALTREVDMAAANTRLAEAENRVTASVSAYGSSATFPNMVKSPMGVMPGDMQSLNTGQRGDLGLDFYKPLSTGGRISANIAQKRLQASATEADLQAARLQVYYQTRITYREVLLRLKLLDVYRQDVAARQELLRVDNVRYKAGKIPLYYTLRDESSLANSQQKLANEQRDLETAMYNLSVIMGLPQPREVKPTEALGYQPVKETQAAALQAAMAQRPELGAARARIAAAQAGVQVAKSTYKPQIGADVLFDAMAASGGNNSGGYTAAVVLSLPLLDGGSRAAEVNHANSRVAQLTQQERQTALEVSQQVMTALADLRAAGQNVQTAQQVQASAKEDYRVASLRYHAGKSINLEPLDALAALVQAQVNLARALYEYNNAVDRVEWAKGSAPTGVISATSAVPPAVPKSPSAK